MILKSVPVPPIVWSIAGSDPCSGAGLQADIKTVSALGGHACTVVTAVTAQNTVSVSHVHPVSETVLTRQLLSLQGDLPPKAIKIGMLGSRDTVRVLRSALPDFGAPVVCDPVLASSSGMALLDAEGLALFKRELLPLVDVLTPNIPEAEILTGLKIRSPQDAEKAARALLDMGAKAVVIKGGHISEESTAGVSQDLYASSNTRAWLTSPRLKDVEARGTGCTFSSSLATGLALGFDSLDAFVMAKTYVNQSLRTAKKLGSGAMILGHGPWQPRPRDLPWLTKEASAGLERPWFADCGMDPLGFYPVIDRVEWLERLLPLGVTTAQLRVKDLVGEALESEIKRGIEVARNAGCRLFINDYWQLALKHGAYGVHLGQEDLEEADLLAIHRAGLRLGLSTHCFAEVARAHSLRPSYVAIGPVFPTLIKSMRFAPQGEEAFRAWRRLLDYPLVAIGGITLETADGLIAAGADAIAVVSDVTKNAEPEARVQAWLEKMKTSLPQSRTS